MATAANNSNCQSWYRIDVTEQELIRHTRALQNKQELWTVMNWKTKQRQHYRIEQIQWVRFQYDYSRDMMPSERADCLLRELFHQLGCFPLTRLNFYFDDACGVSATTLAFLIRHTRDTLKNLYICGGILMGDDEVLAYNLRGHPTLIDMQLDNVNEFSGGASLCPLVEAMATMPKLKRIELVGNIVGDGQGGDQASALKALCSNPSSLEEVTLLDAYDLGTKEIVAMCDGLLEVTNRLGQSSLKILTIHTSSDSHARRIAGEESLRALANVVRVTTLESLSIVPDVDCILLWYKPCDDNLVPAHSYET